MHWKFGVVAAMASILLAGCMSNPPHQLQLPDEDGIKALSTGDGSGSTNNREVIVFFFYSCPHCYDFHTKHLKAWVASRPNANVVQIPVTWNESLGVMARAYYAGEVANINPLFHEAVYSSIHQNPTQDHSESFFAALAESCCNISGKKYVEIFRSSEVDRRLAASDAILKRINVSAVPEVIVNGRHLVDPNTAGGSENMISAIEELLKTHINQRIDGLVKED